MDSLKEIEESKYKMLYLPPPQPLQYQGSTKPGTTSTTMGGMLREISKLPKQIINKITNIFESSDSKMTRELSLIIFRDDSILQQILKLINDNYMQEKHIKSENIKQINNIKYLFSFKEINLNQSYIIELEQYIKSNPTYFYETIIDADYKDSLNIKDLMTSTHYENYAKHQLIFNTFKSELKNMYLNFNIYIYNFNMPEKKIIDDSLINVDSYILSDIIYVLLIKDIKLLFLFLQVYPILSNILT
jgi:hypothetical protein